MALEDVKKIEQLADCLTRCADSVHERLMKAISAREINRFEAQAIFQDETGLRQRANGLYLDAAKCIVRDLEIAQKELIGVVATANKAIRNIERTRAFIDLVADVLTLAAAACAAKPGPIVAALEEIKNDIDPLR
jgi:hypothetical protein